MKRVRCPKCDNYIIFDETKYKEGQSLVFQCSECGKEFGIRMGTSKLRNRQKDENPDENANENGCGSIVVIENVFHYKQVLPLKMGDNIIGRYMFQETRKQVSLNIYCVTVRVIRALLSIMRFLATRSVGLYMMERFLRLVQQV